MHRQFKIFSWYGLSLKIPEKWSPGEISGNQDKGSVRIADLKMERISISWRKVSRQVDMEKIVQKHVEKIERDAKRKKFALELKRRLNWPLKGRYKGEFFWWKADLQAYNLFFQTEKKNNNRVFFLRILGKLNEDIKADAKRIASSIKVNQNQSPIRWSIFGLDTTLPEDFKLDTYNFLTGLVRMRFLKRGQELNIEKLSLAERLLEGKNLTQWVLENYKKELKSFNYGIKEGQVQGHPGLTLSGERRNVFARKLGKNRIKLLAWHCQDTNKILVLSNRYKYECEIESIAKKTRCHSGDDLSVKEKAYKGRDALFQTR